MPIVGLTGLTIEFAAAKLTTPGLGSPIMGSYTGHG